MIDTIVLLLSSNVFHIIHPEKFTPSAHRNSKRVHEKDNEIQLDFLEKYKRRKKFEVLRMEVRLNKRQKMKQLFAKLGIKADLIFKKLFKPAISKKSIVTLLRYTTPSVS